MKAGLNPAPISKLLAFGDAGYRGVDKREEALGPQWHVAMKPGKRKQLNPGFKWA